MGNLLLRTALLLAAAAMVGAALGWLLGPHWGWGLFCAFLFALLVHHLRQLATLSRWVSGAAGNDRLESVGVWDEVFARLYRRQRDEIRKRRRFARLLARSQQAGRALPYGVTILAMDKSIVWCNDSAETHFGISAKRDIGRPIVNLVRQPAFLDYIHKGHFAEALELTLASPEEMVLSVQLVPYVEKHSLLLSQDVTQAHKLLTMRRDFVANVSHELRTPLTVMVGFLETVRDLKLDATRSRDYLNLMAEQGQRMQRIIEDLLTLSTIESSPLPPGEERIDCAALLAQVRNEAESLSAGRHHITLDAEPGIDLKGNVGEIASAFSNLAINAVRYTPAGGHIQIRWKLKGSKTEDSQAEYCVEDDGIGIAPEHIPRLTERFYRVDRSRSRETGGTGLGLAIVKHALARHQANLDVDSTPGHGSRFMARFPASRVLVKAPTQSAARTETVAG